MAFALAWKLRCAVINPISSEVRSTFDLSTAPARIDPKAEDPGSPKIGAPEFAVAKKLLSPLGLRLSVLGKLANNTFPTAVWLPFE